MGQKTVYKRSMSGSLGSGMQSVFAKGGRRYYILEHKVSSKYHSLGENQKIIVDEIELGREPSCQVRYDESFTTVSRRHTAIVREGDAWKLVQLSSTNSTYLNGHKVESEWYLQNGDEIQLSTNGPKLGFIIPAGDKGLVKSIGMTARLNLFRQQALRPYKTALAILGILLLLACGASGYYLSKLYQENRAQAALIAANEERHAAEKAVQDSLLSAATQESEQLRGEVSKLKKQFKAVSRTANNIAVATGNIDNVALDKCMNDVYFIYSTSIDVTLPTGESGSLDCSDKDVPQWGGTGFLMANGVFVTARHVIEPWSYWAIGDEVNEAMVELNAVMNNGGSVCAHFTALSSSGQQIALSSRDFRVDKSQDEVKTVEDGLRLSLASRDATDHASTHIGASGGLSYDKGGSTSLSRGTKLTVLGFPLGLGANSPTSITPISSTATVGVDGLDKGVILTSETNFEHGCSGAPAFVVDSEGHYVVIGVVSAIAGRNTGFIVPISYIK